MNSIRKQKVYDLLKGIETGDPESVKVVNETKYIQHNPQTQEGGEGLAVLFKKLSKTSPRVDIVRLFEDGDHVFGHTIYDFSSVRIGFEVFRYEGEQVVEHWDNIQPRVGNMVGGWTEKKDDHLTEVNRKLVREFVERALIAKNPGTILDYLDFDNFLDHSTLMKFTSRIEKLDYQKNHLLLADGNFVLSVNEGKSGGIPSSFYDLFRIEKGQIVEHWDTFEKIPPKSEWKNNNGKF